MATLLPLFAGQKIQAQAVCMYREAVLNTFQRKSCLQSVGESDCRNQVYHITVKLGYNKQTWSVLKSSL